MSCIRTLKDKTSTPLAGNASYTGASIKTEMYNGIRGLVSTDQGGTLKFEESEDGSTWVQTASSSITGGTPQAFEFVCHGYYARVKLTNGATIQTTLNLQVYADPFF